MIRVAVADDHPELRLALRLLLHLSDEIEIVCEAANGQEALDCVKELLPDVLVMDIQMPVLDGFTATERILELGLPTRVLLFSINRGSFYARQAALVGAKGLLAKDDLGTDLLPAIQAVHRGETVYKE
jgi:DNA-binding NarL/FixJ family response regulator